MIKTVKGYNSGFDKKESKYKRTYFMYNLKLRTTEKESLRPIVSISGRKVWRYTGSKLDKGFPKQMEKKDLPYKPTAAYIQKNQYSDYQWYLFAVSYLP